ncbi:MAG TPA: ABC transporter permease subunit [Candidatus Dormibacteraeota bacterium]|nr:ABC transporter permease subunit [Candidatus Dormibacteraeota bacterium]
MSVGVEIPVEPRTGSARALRPSFVGAFRGELLKLRHQRSTIGLLLVAVILFGVVMAALFDNNVMRQTLHRNPQAFFDDLLGILLALFDTGSGIFLLLVGARLVGMEYDAGTIRVLLARGIDRVQLLLAKWLALVLLGLLLLAGFLVLATVSLLIVVEAWEGSLSPITSLPAVAWHDLGLNLLVALISVGVCILLGTAASVVGRAMAFGVGVAMAFFPADNFGTVVMGLLARITHQTFWLRVTEYLLGPNLNQLPVELQTDHRVRAAFATPLQPVDTTHSLLVIGAYAVVFVVVSLLLIWRRDVLE